MQYEQLSLRPSPPLVPRARTTELFHVVTVVVFHTILPSIDILYCIIRTAVTMFCT